MRSDSDIQSKNNSEWSCLATQLFFLAMCGVCFFLWLSVDLLLFAEGIGLRSFALPRYKIVFFILLFSLAGSSRFSINKTYFDEKNMSTGLQLFRWFVWFFGLLICNLCLYLWWTSNLSVADPFIKDMRRYAITAILVSSLIVFSRCIVRKEFHEIKQSIMLKVFLWFCRLASLSIIGACIYLWLPSDLLHVDQYVLEKTFLTILLLFIFSAVTFSYSHIKKEIDQEKKRLNRRPTVVKYLEKTHNEYAIHFFCGCPFF